MIMKNRKYYYPICSNYLFLLLFPILLLAGCQVSRVNKIFGGEYKHAVNTNPIVKTDAITIIADSVYKNYQEITQETKKGDIEPFLCHMRLKEVDFYWLHPKIAVYHFTETVNTYANKGLKQKLNDRKLELSIDSVPLMLYIQYQRTLWDFIGTETANIQSCSCNALVVSYRVISPDGTLTKAGALTIPDKTRRYVSWNMYHSVENRMLEYSNQYNTAIESMAKHFVDKLIPLL